MSKSQPAKKIVVFCDTFPPPFVGGAEFSVFDLVNSFKELGCTVQVFSLKNRTKTKFGKNLKRTENCIQISEYFDFPYHPGLTEPNRGKASRIFWHFLHLLYFPHFYSVLRTTKRFSPNLIYCGNIAGWSLTPWVLSKVLKIPLVQIVHDYGFICFRRTLIHTKPNFENCSGECFSCAPRKEITKRFWPGGTLIFVSKKQRELHNLDNLNLRNSSHLIVLPEISSFPASFSPIDKREFEFGYLGRISAEKGIEFALSVLENSQKQLFLAGEGSESYQNFLKSRYPRAVFLGHMDKWQFLDKVKILIVPSLWNEPAGRIVKEALIAGCMVFVSNRGGLVEMGQILPANLRVFDPENEESLLDLVENYQFESFVIPDIAFYEKIKSEYGNLAKKVLEVSEISKQL